VALLFLRCFRLIDISASANKPRAPS